MSATAPPYLTALNNDTDNTMSGDCGYIYIALPPSGVVRLEQKNETFLEQGIFDDGPFEAGDENKKDPALVPAPPNSYLGNSEFKQSFSVLTQCL